MTVLNSDLPCIALATRGAVVKILFIPTENPFAAKKRKNRRIGQGSVFFGICALLSPDF
jgi:hypothetical protein